MKKRLLFLVLISSIQLSVSQEYYIVGKDTLDKKELKRTLKKSKQKLISKKIITTKDKLDYRIKKSDIIEGVTYNLVDIVVAGSVKNEKLYGLLNKFLPDFLLPNLEGKLTSSFFIKERPTLLNLWFVNCPPCIKEIPELNRIKKQYGDRMNFVAMTFDKEEDVKVFLKKKEFNFLILTNAKSYLSENLGNKSYPKILLLDRNGVIRSIEGGIPSHEDESKKRIYHTNALIKQIEILLE